MNVRLHDPVNSARSKGSPRPRTRVAKSSTPVVKAHAPDLPDLQQMAKAQVAARELARHADVSREAYFRAERRGFAPGFELEDWLAAEAEVFQYGEGAVLSSVDDPVEDRHGSPDVTPVR